MSTAKPQAISGVSSENENIILTVYPSVGATLFGQWLGRMYEWLPTVPGSSIRLSYLLTLPTAPIALLIYILQKITGSRYVLTNRSVQIWSALTPFQRESVSLSDISRIEVQQGAGQVFYKAADVVVRNSGGQIILRLQGVVRAEVFVQSLQKAMEARRLVSESLAVIEAR